MQHCFLELEILHLFAMVCVQGKGEATRPTSPPPEEGKDSVWVFFTFRPLQWCVPHTKIKEYLLSQRFV